MSEVKESTALVVIRAELPTVLSADKDDILGNLQRELAGFGGDASTEKGRKEIASKAYKVSVAKKDLERLAATLKESAQRTLNGINAEVRVIKDRMDALRDQVRKPLDDYEARIAQFETDIKTIEGWADVPAEWTSDQIEARIAELQQHEFTGRDWQEFAQRAQKAATLAFNALKGALTTAREREDAAAEEARRQAEEDERWRQQEERRHQERETEIARQAAERARQEAEAKAERDRQEAERRAHVEREASERREREAQRAAQAAEQRAREAEARAERERQAAKEREERARQEAVEAERRRLEAEERRKRDEEEARARNKAHRTRINQEALAAIQAAITQCFEAGELSQEAIGKAVIVAIAKGAVPHISIQY